MDMVTKTLVTFALEFLICCYFLLLILGHDMLFLCSYLHVWLKYKHSIFPFYYFGNSGMNIFYFNTFTPFTIPSFLFLDSYPNLGSM